MALPLFALSFGACGDDDNNKTDGSTKDMAVSVDGSKGDASTDTDGGTKFPAPPALGAQIDRLGRAGVNTALTDPFYDNGDTNAAETHHAKQDAYNAESDPSKWAALTLTTTSGSKSVLDTFRANLAVYDALDGTSDGAMVGDGCGNQLAYATLAHPDYATLATVLSRDVLFVNAGSGTCTTYLGVEANALGVTNTDCGGRTPTYDTIDITYSALASAAAVSATGCLTSAAGACGVTDGVNADPDSTPMNNTFPFLAAAQ
ncbi:MAG: DUF4331 family protein [Polyangia bacterium]